MRLGLGRVVGRQEPHAEVGLAEPAAGVDARAEREAELPAVAQLGDAGRLGERRQARRQATSGDLQPLADEGAVEALERHHIADGAERHEVEPAQKIGHPVALPPATQLTARGDEEKKGDPHRGQVAHRARLVPTVRVDDGQRLRQLRLGRVVVDDDDLLAGGGAVRQRREGGGAVVQAEDQAAAGPGQPVERSRAGAVAVDQPVGDEDDGIDPEGAGEADEERRRGGAVDVVVADDAEPLAGPSASASRATARSRSRRCDGSGSQSRSRGSRKPGTASGPSPRPARTRPISSPSP